jgi:8-oxo-dGTP diphosphatase
MTAANGVKPSIGVAVVVWRDENRQELLLGLGHSGENRETIYAVPGGHWESGETLAAAVRRETLEEAGIEVSGLSLVSVYEFFNPEKQKSYVTIGFSGMITHGEPTVMEPDKKSNWGWYTPEAALALPLFVPDEILIRRAVQGPIYQEVIAPDSASL